MNWRKGIRDVIDDIISRMELISEAVFNIVSLNIHDQNRVIIT